MSAQSVKDPGGHTDRPVRKAQRASDTSTSNIDAAEYMKLSSMLNMLGRNLTSVSNRSELLKTATSYLRQDLSYKDALIVLEDQRKKRTCCLSRHGTLQRRRKTRIPIQFNQEIFGNIFVTNQGTKLRTVDYEILEMFCGFLAVGLHNIRRFDEVQQLAMCDPVTSVYNRRGLLQLGELVLQATNCTAAIVFDIDHFKQINDRLGHSAGDAVLQLVTAVVRQCVRKADFLGRYGGDEFVVLLPRTQKSKAIKVAKRMCSAVRVANLAFRGEPLSCTISAGVACGGAGVDLSCLIGRADRALYSAKHRGGDSVAI